VVVQEQAHAAGSKKPIKAHLSLSSLTLDGDPADKFVTHAHKIHTCTPTHKYTCMHIHTSISFQHTTPFKSSFVSPSSTARGERAVYCVPQPLAHTLLTGCTAQEKKMQMMHV